MDQQDAPPLVAKRWNPWVVFFAALGLLPPLVIATLIGGAALVVNRNAGRVAAELARIRDAGEPASGLELEDLYQLPADANDTTELWLDATRPLETEAFADGADELPIVGTGDSEVSPPGEPWDGLEASEGLLREYRDSLRDMHKAAELGGEARYPVDFSLGLNAFPDHASSCRSGARLLALQAHVCAHRGDPAGAARSIRTVLKLGQSLEREPLVASLLVRLDCHGIAREQLKILLPNVGFSDADLRALQDDLLAIDYHDGLHQAMLGERALGIDGFENPESLGVEVPAAAGGLWRFTHCNGFVFYLKHMNRMAAAAQQPWPRALRAAERAEATLDSFTESASSPSGANQVFPAIVASGLVGIFNTTAHDVAMNRSACTAVAVERYRRVQGMLPKKLGELAPDLLTQIPADPFNGQPLRYVARGEEYFVYSVGYDRTDDGGTANAESYDFEPDKVFHVRRPL